MQASLTSEFVATCEKENLHTHVSTFTRVNETLFSVDGEEKSSLELKCIRWLLSWPGSEELSSEIFLTESYKEFVISAHRAYRTICSNLDVDFESTDEFGLIDPDDEIDTITDTDTDGEASNEK